MKQRSGVFDFRVLAAHPPLLQASPEQILGLRCSAATDLYSVGVLLWELVTGELFVSCS